jgi:hypothetical protein
MASDYVTELRRDAKAHGIPWNYVRDEFDRLKAEMMETAWRDREPRIVAWHFHVGGKSGSAPFWRHGFRARFGRAWDKGADHTIIPRYDEMFELVASQFPEWEGRESEFFAWLMVPAEKLPSTRELWEQAYAAAWQAKESAPVDCARSPYADVEF